MWLMMTLFMNCGGFLDHCVEKMGVLDKFKTQQECENAASKFNIEYTVYCKRETK